MSPFRCAAFVAVLLAVAAVQPSQADEAAIKDTLVAQTMAFVNKHVTHGNVDAAVRGRSLAEKSGICAIMESTLACQAKAQGDCTGTCAWQSGTCEMSDAAALTSVMSSGMMAVVAPALVCSLDAACTDTACTKGDTCAPTAAAITAALPNDKVLADIMTKTLTCGSWTSADTCGKASGCAFDASDSSCGISDSAGGNMAPMLIKECGLTMPSVSAATSSVVLSAAMAIVVLLGTLFVM